MTLAPVGPPDRRGTPEVAPVARTVGAMAAAVALAIATAALGAALYAAVRARAIAAPGRALAHAEQILAVERVLHLDVERGVQAVLLPHPWAMAVLDTVYALGYWPILVGAAVVLVVRDRCVAVRFGVAVLASGLVGMSIFAVVPVAPPRMLDGFVDTVAGRPALAALAQPRGLANPYAAMPSFHVGWVVLATVAAAQVLRGWPSRLVLAVPGVAMTASVLATGNHFLLDIAAGIAVALGGWAVAGWLTSRLPAVGEGPLRPAERSARP